MDNLGALQTTLQNKTESGGTVESHKMTKENRGEPLVGSSSSEKRIRERPFILRSTCPCSNAHFRSSGTGHIVLTVQGGTISPEVLDHTEAHNWNLILKENPWVTEQELVA